MFEKSERSEMPFYCDSCNATNLNAVWQKAIVMQKANKISKACFDSQRFCQRARGPFVGKPFCKFLK